MINSPTFSRKTRLLLGLTGVVIVTGLFAGCSKQASLMPENKGAANQEVSASPDTAVMNAPAVSPMIKATNTTDAETKESAQLDSLNKDASSVDQGLNDQAIPVN